MTTRTAAALLAAATLTLTGCTTGNNAQPPPPAATATLTGNDNQFLHDLAQKGIHGDPNTLTNGGRTSCTMLTHGGTPADFARGNKTPAKTAVPGIPNEHLPDITEAAVRAYCPQFIEGEQHP